MYFYFFILSPQDLAPSDDRRETLPRDRYLAEFYNKSTLKNLGTKHAKFRAILHNFRL